MLTQYALSIHDMLNGPATDPGRSDTLRIRDAAMASVANARDYNPRALEQDGVVLSTSTAQNASCSYCIRRLCTPDVLLHG